MDGRIISINLKRFFMVVVCAVWIACSQTTIFAADEVDADVEDVGGDIQAIDSQTTEPTNYSEPSEPIEEISNDTYATDTSIDFAAENNVIADDITVDDYTNAEVAVNVEETAIDELTLISEEGSETSVTAASEVVTEINQTSAQPITGLSSIGAAPSNYVEPASLDLKLQKQADVTAQLVRIHDIMARLFEIELALSDDRAISLGIPSIVSEEFSTFDYILDPSMLLSHSAFENTKGIKYAPDASMFFYNSDGKYDFSDTTDLIIIDNENDRPILLTINVTLSKVEDIRFVDFMHLKNNEAAAMCLALQDEEGNLFYVDSDGVATITASVDKSFSFKLVGACNDSEKWREVTSIPKLFVSWSAELDKESLLAEKEVLEAEKLQLENEIRTIIEEENNVIATTEEELFAQAMVYAQTDLASSDVASAAAKLEEEARQAEEELLALDEELENVEEESAAEEETDFTGEAAIEEDSQVQDENIIVPVEEAEPIAEEPITEEPIAEEPITEVTIEEPATEAEPTSDGYTENEAVDIEPAEKAVIGPQEEILNDELINNGTDIDTVILADQPELVDANSVISEQSAFDSQSAEQGANLDTYETTP